MRPFRNLKVASAIEHELTQLLARDFSVPDTLVTVTDVAVDEDLLQARVKLGIIPKEKEVETLLELEKRRREFDHAIFKKLNIRPMPHLKFVLQQGSGQ
ncbi:MAG: ribosome-binding factor A [Candidatus Jorgensenbacteria bacterium]